MPDAIPDVIRALTVILRELVEGAGPDEAWLLNRGDRGLLASLEGVTAAAASIVHGGRSSVAAHLDHVRYGLELLNRWANGDDPFGDADWSASWRRLQVSDDEWQVLRMALAREARAWITAVEERRHWDEQGLKGAIASAAHIAYHLGAIRQMDAITAGPRAGH